ncbi:MAG: BrnT family toxin [Thermomicrobiales bacterium]
MVASSTIGGTWNGVRLGSGKVKQEPPREGIDFADATPIFDDPHRIERTDVRRDYGEVRIKSIGRSSDGAVLVVVHTIRNGVTRIISARRANKHERHNYDQGPAIP